MATNSEQHGSEASLKPWARCHPTVMNSLVAGNASDWFAVAHSSSSLASISCALESTSLESASRTVSLPSRPLLPADEGCEIVCLSCTNCFCSWVTWAAKGSPRTLVPSSVGAIGAAALRASASAVSAAATSPLGMSSLVATTAVVVLVLGTYEAALEALARAGGAQAAAAQLTP
eukprot:scaffold6345_cov376-Prasinococcus_capsulatus_cf.AAC.3